MPVANLGQHKNLNSQFKIYIPLHSMEDYNSASEKVLSKKLVMTECFHDQDIMHTRGVDTLMLLM